MTEQIQERPLRRDYWSLLIDFMSARFAEEAEAWSSYNRPGGSAPISLAVGAHKVYSEARGDENLARFTHDDLQGRTEILLRVVKARAAVSEYTKSDRKRGDAVLASEAAGLGFALIALSTPYRNHPDHPGMHPR